MSGPELNLYEGLAEPRSSVCIKCGVHFSSERYADQVTVKYHIQIREQVSDCWLPRESGLHNYCFIRLRCGLSDHSLTAKSV